MNGEHTPFIFYNFEAMILYNVTINIDDDIHQEWVEWMQSRHIPDVMSTGLFIKNKMCRLIDPPQEGITYSVQYFCKGMEEYIRYQEEFAEKLQMEHSERYKNKFVAFRTLMEVVEENWATPNN